MASKQKPVLRNRSIAIGSFVSGAGSALLLVLGWQAMRTPHHQTSQQNTTANGICSVTQGRRIDGGVVHHISPNCYPQPLMNIHKLQTSLSARTCNNIIKAAEKRNQWTEKSSFGKWQSTRDVGLDALIEFLDRDDIQAIERFVGMHLSTFAWTNFIDRRPGVDGMGTLGSHDHFVKSGLMRPDGSVAYEKIIQLKGMPFVIKYDADDIPNVRLHKDNADVSFIVLLSDETHFEGGGTVFDTLPFEGPLMLRQGEALIFNGQHVHGAAPVTKGTRYVLSGFTTFSAEFLDLKRRSTLAGMPYMH